MLLDKAFLQETLDFFMIHLFYQSTFYTCKKHENKQDFCWIDGSLHHLAIKMPKLLHKRQFKTGGFRIK